MRKEKLLLRIHGQYVPHPDPEAEQVVAVMPEKIEVSRIVKEKKKNRKTGERTYVISPVNGIKTNIDLAIQLNHGVNATFSDYEGKYTYTPSNLPVLHTDIYKRLKSKFLQLIRIYHPNCPEGPVTMHEIITHKYEFS